MVQPHEEKRPLTKQEDPDAVEIVRDPHFRFGAGYGDLEEEREQKHERGRSAPRSPH